MQISDTAGFVGHQIHICRRREAGTLLRWLSAGLDDDLHGKTVLDVAGGDGYWAARLRRRGARAICVDLATAKLTRGRSFRHAPVLVKADALRLPLRDGSVDGVLSICAVEHFADGPKALNEMARVLKPGGVLVMSADTLSRADQWPGMFSAHCRRYHVRQTYTHDRLGRLLAERDIAVQEHSYQFRTQAMERFYLGLSAHGGKLGWNVAAPLTPLVALADRWAPNTRGSIVLIRGRKDPSYRP